MRPLGAQDILYLCDACQGQGSAARALAILARAEPGIDHRDLPVGARDARLMAVRRQTFARPIDLVSLCPSCAAAVELSVTVGELGLDAEGPSAEPQLRSIGGRALMVRPVTAGDLADAEILADLQAVRRLLLGRCVMAVDGKSDAPVPEAIADEIEDSLEQLDPCADIALELTCPACKTTWSVAFDAAEILWSDIKAAAARLMADVAALARVYHWSERDILAMPAARRRFYLEAAG
jgi:hypothetical protein